MSTKIIPIDQQLLKHLKKYHRGEEACVCSRNIEILFGINNRAVRTLVSKLRLAGCPICSNEKGYFYAATKQEMQDTVKRLCSHGENVLAAANAMHL